MKLENIKIKDYSFSKVLDNSTQNKIIDEYNYYLRNNRFRSLEDCYNSYSCFKYRAWQNDKEMCNILDGFNFGISSFNSNVFTEMFEFYHEGKHYVAKITASYNYLVEVE